MAWKILTSKKDIVNPGVYQEKLIVCCGNKDNDYHRLRNSLKESHPEAEECEVPKDILSLFPASFGYWVNKHDPKCSLKDIKEGNIRIKID